MKCVVRVQEEQVKDSGKSSAIVSKMIEGKVSKFISENTLLGQSLSTVNPHNPTVRTHTITSLSEHCVAVFMFTAHCGLQADVAYCKHNTV
jgi:translation elongation factor EF-Ts